MNLRLSPLSCAVILSAFAATTDAGTFVQYRQGTSGPWTTLHDNYTWDIPNNPVLPIDLDNIGGPGGLPFGTWYFRVWNSSATEDLGHIYFVNTSTARSVVLIIASLADPNADVLNPSVAFLPGCRDFGGTQLSGVSTLTTQISIQRDLVRYSALYNQIRADRLIRLDVGGSISDGVAQLDNGQTHAAMGPVFCGTLNASVSATRGNITSVNVSGSVGANGAIQASDTVANTGGIGSVSVSGNLGGFVRSLNGSIASIAVGGDVTARIHAENGAIGDVTIQGSLSSPDETGTGNYPIRSKNGINKLVATSVDANITAATNGGNGRIGLFKTTNGSMSKTLVARELFTQSGGAESGIVINGDLTSSGFVRFFSGGAHAESIKIKGSLAGEIRFDDAADLDTQIVVNAGNSGGTWANTGKVILDYDGTQTVLAPTVGQPYQGPYYQSASATLGGGAVGLVPYHIYPADDTRTGDGSSGSPTWVLQSEISGQIAMTNEQPLLVPFYGPLVAGSDLARIEWFDGTSWTTPPAQFFRVVAGASGVNPRMLLVGARQVGFPARNIPVPIGRYRVVQDSSTPDAKKVRCDKTLVTGTPPAVADFTYYFCVLPDCNQDGALDGDTTACDTFTACSTGEGVNCVADCSTNGTTGTPDGAVDINDLLYFLILFEAGSIDADIDNGWGGGVPDQATDINDLLFFINHFEAGC